MLIVIDDVLDKESLSVVQGFFRSSDTARQIQWINGDLALFLAYNSPLSTILNHVTRVFNLSEMIGIEQWAHYGTKPDWHVDKDEVLLNRTGKVLLPICSIVFYAEVDQLTNGKFMTENMIITPKTNRLLAFAPGISHGVEDYTGTRLSVAINPWSTKPEGH